ncbi:CRY1 [Branchiostoma lanceolatum]|uniref:CRY1 protein n=1 Tax=Branchiostoma lanceolatum TaxID=7740 RepID=A0A8J9ZAS8_BRALA|nr:CRY1 [Branchiostoma lanceolatum]
MTDKEINMEVQGQHNTIHWFRKGLRFHDNPSLLHALRTSRHVYPVFVLDLDFMKDFKIHCGDNQWRFVVQCLQDLDHRLRMYGLRLFVVRGNAEAFFKEHFQKWNITQLTHDIETEHYHRFRDAAVRKIAEDAGVEVVNYVAHTLYNVDKIIEYNGGTAPLTYRKFQKVLRDFGKPPQASETATEEHFASCSVPPEALRDEKYNMVTLEELGIRCENPTKFVGGETEGLRRVEKHLQNQGWITQFEKPKTEPTSLLPSTTGLSPYFSFGCLSVRHFYHRLDTIYAKAKDHSLPPVSLQGQLLWREFFYVAAAQTPNFVVMAGNPICLQIPWYENREHLRRWRNGETGFPWIDAIMAQLHKEGWIHHLARHAVACFLTRGDLWISWEEGQKVFEELLLDADYSVNAGNWMWLSGSAFYHQYTRIFCPVRFGKRTDPDGTFIRAYLPVLKDFPAQYIYEPWKAPLKVQEAAGCIVGRDYSFPMVDHEIVSQQNLELMREIREQQRQITLLTLEGREDGSSTSTDGAGRKRKRPIHPEGEDEIVKVVVTTAL